MKKSVKSVISFILASVMFFSMGMSAFAADGQPADTGYHGTAAEEDLRGIKHEYQRKGILFVAAAIGDAWKHEEAAYKIETLSELINIVK